MNKTPAILIILLVLGLLGYANVSEKTAQSSDRINMEILSPIFPPVVGIDELVLRVTDAQTGLPVSDAYLSVKGDMTHDGMVPVLSSARGGTEGEYTVPFEWTMGGDWIVTVNASLPDGTLIEQSFDLPVNGDELICGPAPN